MRTGAGFPDKGHRHPAGHGPAEGASTVFNLFCGSAGDPQFPAAEAVPVFCPGKQDIDPSG